MIYKFVYAILCLVMFFSCANPSGVDVEQKQSTLIYEDEHGIVSYLTVDKQTYSLDDVVQIGLLTINNSDNHRVHIQSNSGPLWRCSIYDSEMESMIQMPGWVFWVVYDFYFSPGDTFKSDIVWNQRKDAADHRYDDLKVVAGDYYITGSQPGLPPGKVGAWIRIAEEGEPLSTKLYWYFSDSDSIKLDFLLRNRISKMLRFRLVNPAAVKIQFYNSSGNTLFKEMPIDVNFSQLTFSPKSDAHILSYRESKDQLKRMGLNGIYKCRIVIPCEERDIVAEGLIIIN